MRKGFVGVLDRGAFRVFRLCVRIGFTLYFRLSIRGDRSVAGGPLVVCANHQSFLDSLLVGVAVRPRVRFVMSDLYARMPGLGWLFKWNRVILASEERANREMFKESLAALRDGDVLGIFPEGQISLDGELSDFLPGALSLAMRERVPILPVALVGAHRAMHRSMRFPRPRKIRIQVGPPIAPSDLFPDGIARTEALSIGAERLQQRIQELMEIARHGRARS